MSDIEYRTAISQLGLSLTAAGDFLQVGEATSRRWAAGKSRIPGSVYLLLTLMVRMKLTPDKVREWIDAQD